MTTENQARSYTGYISVENCGTLFLFRANTQAGKEWIHDHVPSDAGMETETMGSKKEIPVHTPDNIKVEQHRCSD